jgi:ubiquitin-conjugating enzyme E2 M
MLKIWSMKQQQQKNEAASGQTKKKKVTAAQLRVQKGESHRIQVDKQRGN